MKSHQGFPAVCGGPLLFFLKSLARRLQYPAVFCDHSHHFIRDARRDFSFYFRGNCNLRPYQAAYLSPGRSQWPLNNNLHGAPNVYVVTGIGVRFCSPIGTGQDAALKIRILRIGLQPINYYPLSSQKNGLSKANS